jgi:hypothetical protein
MDYEQYYEELREQLLNKLIQLSKLRNEVRQLEEALRNEAPLLYECFNAIGEEPPSKIIIISVKKD